MLKHQNIIKIHFFDPIAGEQDFYFGSKEAAFERFGEEALGISLQRLRAIPIKRLKRKMTATCIIETSKLWRHSKDKKNDKD